MKSYALLFGLFVTLAYSQEKLVDQSTVLVEKKVITLRDVRSRILAKIVTGESNESSSEIISMLNNRSELLRMRQTLVEETLVDSFFLTGQLKRLSEKDFNKSLSNDLKQKLLEHHISEESLLKSVYLKKQVDYFIDTFLSLRMNTKNQEDRTAKLHEEYRKWIEIQLSRAKVLFLPMDEL